MRHAKGYQYTIRKPGNGAARFITVIIHSSVVSYTKQSDYRCSVYRR